MGTRKLTARRQNAGNSVDRPAVRSAQPLGFLCSAAPPAGGLAAIARVRSVSPTPHRNSPTGQKQPNGEVASAKMDFTPQFPAQLPALRAPITALLHGAPAAAEARLARGSKQFGLLKQVRKAYRNCVLPSELSAFLHKHGVLTISEAQAFNTRCGEGYFTFTELNRVLCSTPPDIDPAQPPPPPQAKENGVRSAGVATLFDPVATQKKRLTAPVLDGSSWAKFCTTPNSGMYISEAQRWDPALGLIFQAEDRKRGRFGLRGGKAVRRDTISTLTIV